MKGMTGPRGQTGPRGPTGRCRPIICRNWSYMIFFSLTSAVAGGFETQGSSNWQVNSASPNIPANNLTLSQWVVDPTETYTRVTMLVYSWGADGNTNVPWSARVAIAGCTGPGPSRTRVQIATANAPASIVMNNTSSGSLASRQQSARTNCPQSVTWDLTQSVSLTNFTSASLVFWRNDSTDNNDERALGVRQVILESV